MEEEIQKIKISALPEALTVSDSDCFLIVQGRKAKRVKPSLMKGKKGDQGLSAYLGVTATHIAWKLGIDGVWQSLISIASLIGPRGEKPIFKKVNGSLMMKYEGEPDTAYVSIFDREELKMKFSDLTPAEKNLLKLHFSDLTADDIKVLQQPATEAAAEVREEMVQISQDVNQVIADTEEVKDRADKSASDADTARISLSESVQQKLTEVDNKMLTVQDGKTTQFEIGTVESGAIPSASLTDNGIDSTGNPKKKLNFVFQKGDKGDRGKDFQILGYYDTITDLRSAIANPEPGEAYGIGMTAPYPIYIWDGSSLDWVNNGAIQGPAGSSGKSARVNRSTGYWQEYDDLTKEWADTEYITQYVQATSKTDGLLSKEDKTKLDGIETEANKYIHPSHTPCFKGLYNIKIDQEGHISTAEPVKKEDITALGIPAQNTTYSKATPEADGLLSKEDKTKLDQIKGGDIEVSKKNIEKVLTGSIASHSHDTIKELSTMPTDVWDGTVSTTLSGTGTKEDPFLVQSCADYIHLYRNPSLYSPVVDFSNPDFNPLAVEIKHIRIEKNLDFSYQEVSLLDALHDMNINPSENASKVLLFVVVDGQNAQIRNINFAGTFSILPLAAYSLVKNLHVLGGRFSVSTDELILKAFAVSGDGDPSQILSMFAGIAEMAICAGVSMSAELHFTGSGNMVAKLITSGIYISELTPMLPQVSFDNYCFMSNVNFTFDNSIPVSSPVMIAYAPAFTNTVIAGFTGYDTSNGQDPSGFTGSGAMSVLMLDGSIPSSPYSLFINKDTTFPYYTNSSTTHYHTEKTTAEMKSQEFLSLLNTDKNIFVSDTDNRNDGYPVFPVKQVEQITYDGYIRNSVFEEYKNNQTIPVSDSIYKLDIDISGLISTLSSDIQTAMFGKNYIAPTNDNILSLLGGVEGVRLLCEKLKPSNGTIIIVPYLMYIIPGYLISNSSHCLAITTGDKILTMPEDGCTINIAIQFSAYYNNPSSVLISVVINNFNTNSQSVAYNYVQKEQIPTAPTAVVDSLTYTTTTDALSANQGRVLKGMIDKKVASDEVSIIKKSTQSAYDALSTKDSKTLYVIVG